jgi:hypothetical protein
VTRWKPDALQALAPLHPELVETKLVGITEAKKLLGKKHEVFDEHTEKPPGKPALVPEDDKRKPLNITSAQADFND